MMLDYYGLREQPFGVAPDPRFLYLSPTHREALASLAYGIESGRGFMALVATPGMGKTTLLFHVLSRLGGSARTAFLFRTPSDPRELIQALLADLEVDAQGQTFSWMSERLDEVLVEEAQRGRRFVVLIDEAQNLSEQVLETVRQWSNFETPSSKLMQIILSGQPALADRLASPSLLQLRQRISVLARLEPLKPAEVRAYIDHRLSVAGYEGPPLLTRRGLERVIAETQGIPRNINNLCFSALSLAYALQLKKIDQDVVAEAASDLDMIPLTSGARGPADSVFSHRDEPFSREHGVEVPHWWPLDAETRKHITGSNLLVTAAVLLALLGSFWLGRGSFRQAGSVATSVKSAVKLPDGFANRNVGAVPAAAARGEQDSSSAGLQRKSVQPSPPTSSEQLSAQSDGSWQNSRPAELPLSPAPQAASSIPSTPGINPRVFNPEVRENERGAERAASDFGSRHHEARAAPLHQRATARSNKTVSTALNARAAQEAALSNRRVRSEPDGYRSAGRLLTEPLSGEVNISTDPPGLYVLVDGTNYGRTPMQRLVSAGMHTYRVLPPSGGAPGEGTFEIKPSALVRINLKWPPRNISALSGR